MHHFLQPPAQAGPAGQQHRAGSGAGPAAPRKAPPARPGSPCSATLLSPQLSHSSPCFLPSTRVSSLSCSPLPGDPPGQACPQLFPPAPSSLRPHGATAPSPNSAPSHSSHLPAPRVTRPREAAQRRGPAALSGQVCGNGAPGVPPRPAPAP